MTESGYKNLISSFLLPIVCYLQFTVSADAFSLGAIEVKSSFDENFVAEIPVRVDGRNGLQVFIGNENDYSRLGIQRDKAVDKLSLHIEPVDKDKVIVRFSSIQPLNQSSINLVIKATLDGGTIIENYFLAVDFQKTLSLNLADTKKSEDVSVSQTDQTPGSLKPVAEKAEEKVVRDDSGARIEELQNVITDLRVRIKDLEAQLHSTFQETSAKAEIIFTKNLRMGDKLKDVEELQKILKTDPSIYPEGVVDGHFGRLTRVAVIRFQEKYASDILLPLNLKSGTGFVGPMTRKKLNSLYGAKILFDDGSESGITYQISDESSVKANKIKQLIMSWEEDWEAKDLEKYISHYSAGFMSRGNNLSSWKEYKREFNDKQKWIEISVENIQIRREGNLIVASFIQKFKSNRINSMGRKTLYFERQGEEWKIKSETWNKDIPSLTHPYVVHIYSFNKRNAAIKTINYLRKEGFSAYESPFNLTDKGIWYRVFVDRFFSKREAEEFAKSIIKRGYANYAKELELPYAIETGIFESDGDAFKEMLRLGEKGYSSYPLMVCDADRCFYHILIGAYTDSEQARPLSEELTNNGIQNKIVQP